MQKHTSISDYTRARSYLDTCIKDTYYRVFSFDPNKKRIYYSQLNIRAASPYVAYVPFYVHGWNIVYYR